jgi:rhodanese-related sulfurtransferase
MNLFNRLFGAPIPALTPVEAQARLTEQPALFLLDVREPDEYRQGHVAGATLIPLGELSRRMGELPKDRELLCICHSGNRSRAAAQHLAAAGYKVVNLQGGMFAWEMARLPVKKGMGA